MKKAKISTLLVGVMVIATSINVMANTTFIGYGTTVGKLNGNGYTLYDHTKSSSGSNGYIRSNIVGGGYTVDVRMLDASGTAGDWRRSVKSGTLGALDGHINHLQGEKMRLQFSNNLNTTVDVQVSGEWRSDS